MTRMALALAAVALWTGGALADKTLSGEDAAYIDWGVKNCGVTSTDKEHGMVDQANAKDSAAFLRQYQSKNLADATTSPSKQQAMCADIKAWYGPLGIRISDLIKWDRSPATAADKPPADTTAGRKGRRRSNQ
jgi:hypothetical protein